MTANVPRPITGSESQIATGTSSISNASNSAYLQFEQPNDHLALAKLLLLRFHGRRDAYAIKGHTGYHVARNGEGMDLPLTVDAIVSHLQGRQPIGVYLFEEPGGKDAHFATLDLDDKGGAQGWPRVADVAGKLIQALEDHGMHPFPVLSGGGYGVHLHLFFERAVSAWRVRRFLGGVLDKLGLKSGDGSLARGEVEIFPKQDRVRNYGNLVALPFARASVPLNPEMEPQPIDEAHEWLNNARLSPLPPVIHQGPTTNHSGEDQKVNCQKSPLVRTTSVPVDNSNDSAPWGTTQLKERPQIIREGEGRDNQIFSLACELHRMGYTQDEVRAQVQSFNLTRCVPPLDKYTIETKVASAWNYHIEEAEKNAQLRAASEPTKT